MASTVPDTTAPATSTESNVSKGSNTADDQKQLANDTVNGEDSTTIDSPTTFDLALQFYQLSKDLMEQNKLEESIEAGYQAINIGEPLVDTNDIRLADFYMQYGKVLLHKMQQSKGILDTDDNNNNGENNADNEDSTEITDDQDTPNDTENTETTKDTKEVTDTANSTTETADNTTNAETDGNKTENNTSNSNNANKPSNGKAEIDDDDEDDGLEQDIDVADIKDTDMADNNNNTNDDNDNTNDNNEETDENNNGMVEESEEDSLRATCWEMLDTARYIIQKYLKTKFNVDLDNLAQEDTNNDIDAIEEEDIDVTGVVDVVEKSENIINVENGKDSESKQKAVSNETNNDKNDSNKSSDSDSNNNNKEKVQNNNSNDKEKVEVNSNENKIEEDQDGDKDEINENEDEEIKYMLLLADVHMLCGEHQLEDNKFEGALESFETAIYLKNECNDTQRELAYCHFYAAMASSHAQLLDVMEEHCIEAKDLLNDKILNTIDSFNNKKYLEKTQDENLDEEGLMKLVNEFCTEYNALTSLNDDEKKSIKEIGDLVEFLKEINGKMESLMIEYAQLRKIEEEQGQSIKDLVLQVMLKQQNGMNGDDNNNNNNNNNGNNNNNNNNNSNTMISVGGIEFGTSGNTENSSDIVNTLSIKSKNSRKRSLEEAGIDINCDDAPLEKKQKVCNNGSKVVEESSNKVAQMTIESKEAEQIVN